MSSKLSIWSFFLGHALEGHQLRYVGQPTFVKCAEEGRRYGECAALKICVESSTTWQDTAKDLFPSTYIGVASTAEELLSFLDLGRCNVAAYDGPMITYLADKGYVWWVRRK